MSGATTIGIAAAAVTAVVLIAGGAVASLASLAGGGSNPLDCTTSTTGASDVSAVSAVSGFTPAQMANAATIVAVGKQLTVPEQGWVVAISAALQESDLVNVDHGDRDSLGLFQERPSQGWGTPSQIMDTTYSSTQFYQHLLAVPHWQQLSINDAAQAVERSAYPNDYGPHVPTAEQIVAAVAGVHCTSGNAPGTGSCTNLQAPNQVALTAVTWACRQLGVPYEWGGNGPELTDLSTGQSQANGGFDCSGLTKAAYAAAGIQIPRTAQTQYDAGPHVPAGQAIAAGDLVFFGSGPGAVTHVGIAISAQYMVDAPHTGAVVRVDRIWSSDFIGATRPAANRSAP